MRPADPDDRPAAAPSPRDPLQGAEEAGFEATNYDQILKSSALIGGSSVLSTLIAVIRTKLLALLLGPTGFGLIGIYTSIADVTRSVAEMGINNSGVRQIADAVGSGDAERIARTITVLRRISLVLGTIGAAILIAFSPWISRLSFGDEAHASAIALLSLVVFFRLVADGQGALIQGTRRIADLAKIGVLGAVFGTLVSVPLAYYLGEQGVAMFLVSIAAMSVVTSWWYSRKIRVQTPRMSMSEIAHEVGELLKFGFAFMANLFLTTGAAFAARAIILRQVGLAAAGLYQSAWSLGGLYCFYIYQGIFADFYPRLVGVASDNRQCNRLVNEQTHVTVLLTGPGVIATLLFAPEIVHLFYSPEFYPAIDTLRWICLGAALRVIFQPMGFIIVAKGRGALFFFTELAWAAVNVALTWFAVDLFGLDGAGMAFLGSYAFYGLMMYPIARRLSGFRWSRENARAGLTTLFLISVTFGADRTLPPVWAAFVGSVALGVGCVYSLRVLLSLLKLVRMPSRVQWLLRLMRLAPRAGNAPAPAETAARVPPAEPAGAEAANAAVSVPPRAREVAPTAECVSILIPAYNAERWIASAIRSALGQSWPNKELIVVDDGSSDRTLEIARSFASTTTKVVAQENRGASAARNRALSLAQGDYIQWLDADDILAPDKIARQLEFAKPGRENLELLSAPFGVFHYRTDRAHFNPTGIWQDLTPMEWIQENFCEHAWMFPGAWLISRRLTENAGPWDERLSLNDDGEYICRVVLASEKVRFVKTALSYYRNSGFTQLSRDTSERALQSLLLSLKLCIGHLRQFQDTPETRRMCVALLQMYSPYFYPDKTRQLIEMRALASELGGELTPPVRNWKVSLLYGLLGPRLASTTTSSIRRIGLAAAVKWDRILANTEQR